MQSEQSSSGHPDDPLITDDAHSDTDAPTTAIPRVEDDGDHADPVEPEGSNRRGLRAWGPRQWIPAASFLIGAVLVTTFFAIGAWQRRWIADDGLIVLRTLRNLFAGNGPVFNAGERVEANTSTAWTYVLWFWAWVTDGQLEYVALWVALLLSVAAIPIAMYGTARLYRKRLGGLTGDGFTLLLPFGAIIYIALPPARDFATSGLENGLCIFWVAVLWCQLVAWSRRSGSGTTGWQRTATLVLAFTAGLAPLVRPELTVLGGLALLMLVLAPTSWKMRVAMIVVAAVLPVGYQIFRMGYYALLVPNPAVAKDASGAKWHQGFLYLSNLFGPYLLLLPVVLAVVAGVLLVVGVRLREKPEIADDGVSSEPRSWRNRLSDWSAALQTPTAVVVMVVFGGLVGGTYWMRQGGDFMHGRVLLVPLFTALLPLMILPVTIPGHLRAAFRGDPAERRKRTRYALAGAVTMAAMWITTLVWAITCHGNVLPNAGTDIGRSGIVDERRFYVTNMGNENPVTAADYLDYPRMHAMVDWIDKYHGQGGVILPSFNYDEWYIAKLPGNTPPQQRKLSVYFLNLGMTSMNAPLDVRVIDQMGLAYPLAAHTERLTDGRIGHDKNLPSEWVVAEAGAFPRRPVLPGYLDEDMVRQAEVALTCQQTKDRFASFQAPWTLSRFRHNLEQAFTFTDYRIEREPEYEIQRCGLTMPPRIHPR
ncbi:flagellar motor control protein ZomB [Gordonia sp. CPCC 206044]|uniref:flagellar motor control protein ZomB n=1 Tax=Gordonia sp. CPCC 206044 TaxID=3140793 RepID=UPI003AF395D2